MSTTGIRLAGTATDLLVSLQALIAWELCELILYHSKCQHGGLSRTSGAREHGKPRGINKSGQSLLSICSRCFYHNHHHSRSEQPQRLFVTMLARLTTKTAALLDIRVESSKDVSYVDDPALVCPLSNLAFIGH